MASQPHAVSREQASVALCYLVRHAEGVEPINRFVQAYREHPAGIDHDLVILFKGFADNSQKEPWQQALADLTYRELDFADVGYTDVPFMQTAKLLNYEYFLFMNTWTYPLAQRWAALMYDQIKDPAVGAVGATASSGSHTTMATRSFQGHFLGRRAWFLRWIKFHFKPFPNFHLRTTGFMISRDVMIKLKLNKIHDKWDAYVFESGKRGFTAQIQRMGLKVLVVGQDGQTYDEANIKTSRTYALGDQENLLMSDNQTEGYRRADGEQRRKLYQTTWENDTLPWLKPPKK